MGENDKGNTRGAARNARAKEAKQEKAEAELAVAYERARELLLDKVTAIRALEKDIAGLRGAMLGIIEAYDLTADQANAMIGFTYFAEAPDMDQGPDVDDQIADVIKKTAAAKRATEAEQKAAQAATPED